VFEENERSVGPQNQMSLTEKVRSCFYEFFTKQMVKLIKNETNDYAEANQAGHQWARNVVNNNVRSRDIKKYLGIRLALGLNRSIEMKNMYSTSFPFNFQLFDILGKSRFEDISSAFHCQLNTGLPIELDESGHKNLIDSDSDIYDVEQDPKVGRILKMFLTQCLDPAKYVICKELSLDEMMIRFQGRSSIIFKRMPKPTSMGIKIFAVTDYHGFLVNFRISRGPGAGPSTEEVVIQLTSRLKKGHVVYIDNYFCSVDVAKKLSKKDILVCGTVRENRGIPEETKVNPKTEPQNHRGSTHL
jgi:hypothetical protein